MATRVQVILDEEDRERFRRYAKKEGLSLSAWLRKAGRERVAAQKAKQGPRTAEELKEFFEQCDSREKGREPDWAEHRKVIETSVRKGFSET